MVYTRRVGRQVWYVLGFTDEDLVGAWQDARLAEECVRAWRAAGQPADFEILQAPGDAEHLTLWFVNATAARLLDEHGVAWRPFLVGEREAPPDGAARALTTGD